VLAAKQVLADLDAARAARPWYTPSSAFLAALTTAQAAVASAASATVESQQGAWGAKGLDAAVHAQVLLFSEAGVQYARAHSASGSAWGVTFDNISGGADALQTVAQLYGRDGWVRIVFDRSQPASAYVDEIAAAHAAGLRVVGELLDSLYMASISDAGWQQRVASYVSTLPDVDEWEVGNEVNGNWLGNGVAAKIAYAANFVKQHTRARTLLTLYWQLGEDDAAHSMFTWAAANLGPAAASIDDIGISLYPENNPMGSSFDRVMRTLHAQFPGQRLMITELGYWSRDLGHTWWWGSQSDPYGAGRLAVAGLYQSAVFGFPYSGGGTFWWYYLQEMTPGSALWQNMHDLHASAS